MEQPTSVVVTDINIPTRRLIWFFFRVSLAAFPAFLTVGFLYATVIHAYFLLTLLSAVKH